MGRPVADEQVALVKRVQGDHVVKDYGDEDVSVTAVCGAVGFFGEDGSLSPEGFDFYIFGYGHEKARCTECRQTLGLEQEA